MFLYLHFGLSITIHFSERIFTVSQLQYFGNNVTKMIARFIAKCCDPKVLRYEAFNDRK